MPIPTDPKKRSYMFSDDMKFLQKIIIHHPSESKFLALKRSEDAVSRPGCWDVAGGNVLFGEVHIDSLLKEIEEETSLAVKNIRPLQVLSKVEGIYYLFIGYACEAVSTDVCLSDEHTEYRWVTKDEFYALESAEFLVELVKLDV